MKYNKAFKFRLYPNNKQSTMIDKTIGCARFIYNKMLDDKIKHYEKNKLILNNYPSQYKEEFPFLKDVDSTALVGSQNNLDTAYKNFFRKLKKGGDNLGFPKFKSKKKSKLSYTSSALKTSKGLNIRIKNNKIKIPKIGFIKFDNHRYIPENYLIKSVTITKTRTNKYVISILLEYEKQIFKKNIEKTLGLDFSMKNLYVDSNNQSPNPQYLKFYKQSQVKLAKEQKSLSRKKYGSKRYLKQKLKVALVHEKITNQRTDFLHKESTKLANLYDMICIEDLNLQEMQQSKDLKLGKSVSDNSFGSFTSMLKYKLEDRGKTLFVVDKWFASSKTCNKCGLVKDTLTLDERDWICECGTKHDRDHNAAMNIATYGLNRTVDLTGIAQVNLSH